MTERTAAMFAFIVEYKRNHDGASPSVRQMGMHFDLSTSQVAAILDKLELAGYIHRERVEGAKGDARSIQVVGGQWTYSGPMFVDVEQYAGVQVAGAYD